MLRLLQSSSSSSSPSLLLSSAARRWIFDPPSSSLLLLRRALGTTITTAAGGYPASLPLRHRRPLLASAAAAGGSGNRGIAMSSSSPSHGRSGGGGGSLSPHQQQPPRRWLASASKVKEKASTSSRTSLTVQGLSFAFNKLRRHPSQAEGDKQSIGVRRSTPVVMDGRYYNPWNTDAAMKTFTDLMNLMRDRRGWPRMPDEELAELRKVMIMDEDACMKQRKAVKAHDQAMKADPYGQGIRVTWINHSSILVQMAGFTFLTDPIWSERCSPFQFAGPRRTFPPPHSLADLPSVDFVLISHNHYDHLDIGTLRQLGPKPTYYVPLGMRDWMLNRGFTNCVELGWWDEGTVTKREPDGREVQLRIACTPAQHWSSRTPFDRMKTLWCSWAVMTNDEDQQHEADAGESSTTASAIAVPRQRFYFGGDSGYCPGFREIGAEYGPFDVAAIPIGAYVPRWFMKDQHIDPQAALQVHRDIGAKHSFGIHWGTFPLAGDAWNEGARELIQGRVDGGMADDAFFLLRPGESWRVGDKREPFLEHYREEERRPLSH